MHFLGYPFCGHWFFERRIKQWFGDLKSRGSLLYNCAGGFLRAITYPGAPGQVLYAKKKRPDFL